MLLCRAGTLRCALPLGAVVEIMRPLPVEATSAGANGVAGVAVIRGTPVPVVALAALLGAASRPRRFVTLAIEGRLVALAVEEVEGVLPISARALGELPPLLRDPSAPAVASIGVRDSALLVVLQTARLVPERGERGERAAAGGAP